MIAKLAWHGDGAPEMDRRHRTPLRRCDRPKPVGECLQLWGQVLESDLGISLTTFCTRRRTVHRCPARAHHCVLLRRRVLLGMRNVIVSPTLAEPYITAGEVEGVARSS